VVWGGEGKGGGGEGLELGRKKLEIVIELREMNIQLYM